MSTYLELQEQIKQLSMQAEAARKSEVQAVINDINAKIKLYNLTPSDLAFASAGKTKGPKPIKESNPALYRSPDGKKTWTGKGREPFWFRDAADKEALRI